MKYEGFKISKESVDKIFPKKDIVITGWESPIQTTLDQMRMAHEQSLEVNTIRIIQAYGITVDKDELIKALQYDRNQYDKGFVNGYNKGASDVAREIFEEIEHKLPIRIVIDGELVYNASIVLEELKKKYESEGEG